MAASFLRGPFGTKRKQGSSIQLLTFLSGEAASRGSLQSIPTTQWTEAFRQKLKKKPKPGQDSTASTSGTPVLFVSSTAENKLKYTGEIQFQRRSEEVLNMKELMVQMLYRYQRGSKGGSQLPKVIIFFRDGVSEGQFKMVLENEIPQLREAFAEVGGKIYCPKLTFVVVIKRHMLRLFVNSVDPNGSAPQQDFPVGTVVDKGIVHPTAWEFYLKSHLAIQGTAKASKYCVLLDENKFTSDELEVVCYILCYGHQIVTKSVSLPAPVYGAHEMAERGKRLWRAFVNAEGSSSGKSSASLNLTDETDWVLMTEKFRVSGTKFTDRKYWA